MGGETQAVVVEGSKLYVTRGRAIHAYDTAGGELSYLGHVALDFPINALEVDAGWAFAAMWWNGWAMVDLTDPAAPGTPHYWQRLTVNGHAKDIAYSSGFLYVAMYWEGLAAMDIRDRANPGGKEKTVTAEHIEAAASEVGP